MSDEPIPYLHDPQSPDIFADAAAGFLLVNGVLRITLESLRCDHSTNPGPSTRVAIGRLVMAVPAAESMARGILAMIEQHRAEPQTSLQGRPTLQ